MCSCLTTAAFELLGRSPLQGVRGNTHKGPLGCAISLISVPRSMAIVGARLHAIAMSRRISKLILPAIGVSLHASSDCIIAAHIHTRMHTARFYCCVWLHGDCRVAQGLL